VYIIIPTHIACTKSPVERKLDNPKNKKEKFFRSNGNKKTREARKKGSVDY
jgi:hypothetical protein